MNSSELRGFLTGLILGDGYIDYGTTKRSFHIKSIREDFIQQIYDELSSCTNFKLRIQYNDAQIRDGVHHKEYWELHIKSHPYFAKKYHHFYNDEKHRIVSKSALYWLTDYGLANWYMSDGYVCLVGKESGVIRDRRVEICTDRYTLHTVNRLRKMLSNKFQINTGLVKRGKRYRIRVRKDSYCHFIRLVQPYIVKSMEYKLYLGYSKQPIWMPNDIWDYQEYLRSATTLAGNAEGYDIV